jgi:hypothetical protein
LPRVAKELGPLDVKRATHAGGRGNTMLSVGGVSGLYLQITPKDGKTWILRAAMGGRRAEIGLGGFPTVTLAQAREKARAARDKIERGIDPMASARQPERPLAQLQGVASPLQRLPRNTLRPSWTLTGARNTDTNGARLWSSTPIRF